MTQEEFLQYVLGVYFPTVSLTPAQVQGFRLSSTIVNFPASFYCDCKRCKLVRSGWAMKAVAGRTLVLYTDVGELIAELPGIPETFQHVWEE